MSRTELWLGRFRKFRSFLGPEVWRLFYLAILVGLGWFVVESSFVFILQGFLWTLGLLETPSELVQTYYPRSIVGSLAVLLLFGACRALVLYLKLYFSVVTNQTFLRSQRIRILDYVMNHAQNESMSRIVTFFNDRVTQGGAVTMSLVQTLTTATTLVLFCTLGLLMAPREMIIAFALLVLFLWPLKKLNQRVTAASRGVQDESQRITRSLILGLKNIFLLRLYGAARGEYERGRDSLLRYETHYSNWCRVYAAKGSLPQLIGVICMVIVSYLGLTYFQTPGTVMISFFYLFFRIAQAASDTNATLNEVRLHWESFKQLYAFHEQINSGKTNATIDESGRPATALETVEFSKVSFGYAGFAEIIRDITIGLKRGDILLIKGESGSGKSTLLSLACGLQAPTGGKILYNGAALGEVTAASIQKQIGYVGPDSFFVEGTLRENLLFGQHLAVTDEDCLEALARAGLQSEFKKWPGGLDYRLGDNTPLSTGQKQRLSFARALLRKPRLLILDEATANLDEENEQHILSTLLKLRDDFITLVVSHRSSYDSLATHQLQMRSRPYEAPARA